METVKERTMFFQVADRFRQTNAIRQTNHWELSKNERIRSDRQMIKLNESSSNKKAKFVKRILQSSNKYFDSSNENAFVKRDIRFVKQNNPSTIKLERIPSNESVGRQTNMKIIKRNADSSNKSIMISLIRQTNLIDTLAMVKQNNESSNEFAASKQIRRGG